ncbi:MAG: MerR family transcriptional regulator [Gemmatimonadales bacterium]
MSTNSSSQAPQGDASPDAYTLDQLAFATGISTRTIRFYQFKGVLPRPVRRGRGAVYDEQHVARLRLIGQLQDRGLSLRAVRHLLREDSDEARVLGGYLGLDESLGKPWSDDRAQMVGHDALEALVGERPPGTIASLVRFGVVDRDRNDPARSYRIPSPALLRVTLALQESGVDVETAARAGDILRRRLGTAARELVKHFATRAGRGFGRTAASDEIGAALDALRPLAGEAARLIFARQIEHALRDLATDGRTRAPQRSQRRRRRGVR